MGKDAQPVKKPSGDQYREWAAELIEEVEASLGKHAAFDAFYDARERARLAEAHAAATAATAAG